MSSSILYALVTISTNIEDLPSETETGELFGKIFETKRALLIPDLQKEEVEYGEDYDEYYGLFHNNRWWAIHKDRVFVGSKKNCDEVKKIVPFNKESDPDYKAFVIENRGNKFSLRYTDFSVKNVVNVKNIKVNILDFNKKTVLGTFELERDWLKQYSSMGEAVKIQIGMMVGVEEDGWLNNMDVYRFYTNLDGQFELYLKPSKKDRDADFSIMKSEMVNLKILSSKYLKNFIEGKTR